jgi:hypothetical protein
LKATTDSYWRSEYNTVPIKLYLENKHWEPGVGTHTYNPSTQKAEAGDQSSRPAWSTKGDPMGGKRGGKAEEGKERLIPYPQLFPRQVT